MVLDLELRLRVHALMPGCENRDLAGILDLTPGIRSLQVHYDSRVLSLDRLLVDLDGGGIGAAGDRRHRRFRPASSTCRSHGTTTPLSSPLRSTCNRCGADAPWCPSNIEFIRRINGLDSIDEVRRIVFDASYLVLGLGDVYLGAPVATPLDPRHRLVTTKYNPARTWTPENAVGIGGAYLCVYGMEGPGGYQFVGRTCQMWNTYHVTDAFAQDRPWLLRFFDQLRFYPVSGAELQDFRADFLHGRARLQISDETFRLRDYRRFLADHAPSIAAHKARQQAAFEAERGRWQAAEQISYSVDLPEAQR